MTIANAGLWRPGLLIVIRFSVILFLLYWLDSLSWSDAADDRAAGFAPLF